MKTKGKASVKSKVKAPKKAHKDGILTEKKKKGGHFCTYLETDQELAKKFHEAGFGFVIGDSIEFHPLEAAYLVKLGKSEFESKGLNAFISDQKKKNKLFPFSFAVYSHIRTSGRQVRPFIKESNYFRVYAPGVGREEERPSQLVCLMPGKLSPKALVEEIALAHRMRMDLIIAHGIEADIRFYKVSSFNF